jgi:hypothetical protein
MRMEARARLRLLLPPGTILCLPTTPFPAPQKGLPLHQLDPLRERIGCLTSQSGLTGVPQVNLPGQRPVARRWGFRSSALAGRTSTFCVSLLLVRKGPILLHHPQYPQVIDREMLQGTF